MRNDQNKTELFKYLGDQSVTLECDEGQKVISSKEKHVLCSISGENLSRISPCNHEEADSQILLHVADMAEEGIGKIMIRTVDTDVVVLAVANYPKHPVEQLWLRFGAGKSFRYLPAHVIASQLGAAKSSALLAFHAISGCDQTSAFASKSRETAWETWKLYDGVTVAFQTLSHIPPEDKISEVMPLIEKFVVLNCTTGQVLVKL